MVQDVQRCFSHTEEASKIAGEFFDSVNLFKKSLENLVSFAEETKDALKWNQDFYE